MVNALYRDREGIRRYAATVLLIFPPAQTHRAIRVARIAERGKTLATALPRTTTAACGLRTTSGASFRSLMLRAADEALPRVRIVPPRDENVRAMLKCRRGRQAGNHVWGCLRLRPENGAVRKSERSVRGENIALRRRRGDALATMPERLHAGTPGFPPGTTGVWTTACGEQRR